jgi:hypothetical protein
VAAVPPPCRRPSETPARGRTGDPAREGGPQAERLGGRGQARARLSSSTHAGGQCGARTPRPRPRTEALARTSRDPRMPASGGGRGRRPRRPSRRCSRSPPAPARRGPRTPPRGTCSPGRSTRRSSTTGRPGARSVPRTRTSPPAGAGRVRPRGSSSVAPVGSRESSSPPDLAILQVGHPPREEEKSDGHDHDQRRDRDLLQGLG